MAGLYCTLIIKAEQNLVHRITQILGLEPSDTTYGWEHAVKKDDLNVAPEIIEGFLDQLEGHYEQLASVGTSRDDIFIHVEYGYPDQLHVRFPAKLLARLGRNGISLGLSAWEIWEDEEPESSTESGTS